MSKNRPVNLDLRTIKQPLPAMVSISHRATGVMLFIGLIFMFILFDLSLSSAEGFDSAKMIMREYFLAKFIAWGLLVSLAFHLFAGVKHLVQDLGYGEELASAEIAAKLVLGATVMVALLAGAWVW
ncbi:MAG: succinate dehydrogenase, cytochrome b556 subunit [Gammaproteobacteria bacterium]|nr:succinate dehydrogenase, cytochrome b556 subunit [Gammaproteobacteria bacterium]